MGAFRIPGGNCEHGKWQRVESAGGRHLGERCGQCLVSFGVGACDLCGKEKILLVRHESDGRRFCSESCKKLAIDKKRAGAKR